MYSRSVKRVFYSAFVRKCPDMCKHRFGVQLLQNPLLCSSTDDGQEEDFSCLLFLRYVLSQAMPLSTCLQSSCLSTCLRTCPVPHSRTSYCSGYSLHLRTSISLSCFSGHGPLRATNSELLISMLEYCPVGKDKEMIFTSRICIACRDH
jgi:hypothetical protein